MVSRQVHVNNMRNQAYGAWSHHHTCHSHLFKYYFVPKFVSFPSTMLSLIFFNHHVLCYISFSNFFKIIGFSLNFHWFNIFPTISRARTWVITSQTYETFQPLMYVNGISPCPFSSSFFQVVNVMLQPLQYNLSTSKKNLKCM